MNWLSDADRLYVFTALSLDADNDAEKTDSNPDSADCLLKQPVQVHGHSGQLQRYGNALAKNSS
ncbi:hypothetical protein [Paenibacillus sp. J2TS4]|uniref:hypothetical protein n=1 Tax=Paenibacillus sp. J2TS4 TaxID=2807194 RepID=UPI001BCAEDE5|nr:hypothetical protein [Paenibacillus sp. J2TS4]